MRSVSIVSSHIFNPQDVERVVLPLGGKRRPDGAWQLVRNNRSILILIGNDDLPIMFPEDDLRDMAQMLQASPRGRLSVLFRDSEDGFEEQMARAISIALSEVWPIVFNDHAGDVKQVVPGGVG